MASKAKPNILFIQTDQHRPDILGCYGNDIVQTPNIDRLAENGVRFNNAFTCTAVCTPARGALLSGQYPHKTGMIYNPEMGNGASRRNSDYDIDITPFSQPLQKRGYRCFNIGKWHIGRYTEQKEYGFEGEFFPSYGFVREQKHYHDYQKKKGVKHVAPVNAKCGAKMYRHVAEHRVPNEASVPGYLASMTIDALKKTGRTKQPFFTMLNFWGPHIPVHIPPEYLYMYDPKDMPVPDSLGNVNDNRPAIVEKMHRSWGGDLLSKKNVQNIIAAYYGYVTLIDHQIGRVLETLEQTGQAENTLVIFSADHGSTLGCHGLQDKGMVMYDEVYRIPMIVSGPMIKKPGRTVDAITNTMDLSATFVDMAGAKVPEQYDGSTLRPYIEGNLKHKIRKEMFMTGFGHQLPFFQRAVHDLKYKYIFNTTCHDEFYDMLTDPGERNNLIDSADEKLVKRYQRKLHKQMVDNKDTIARQFASFVFTNSAEYVN